VFKKLFPFFFKPKKAWTLTFKSLYNHRFFNLEISSNLKILSIYNRDDLKLPFSVGYFYSITFYQKWAYKNGYKLGIYKNK